MVFTPPWTRQFSVSRFAWLGGEELILIHWQGCQVLGELLVKPQPHAGMGPWWHVELTPRPWQHLLLPTLLF